MIYIAILNNQVILIAETHKERVISQEPIINSTKNASHKNKRNVIQMQM